jgi:hypothetical protein
MKPVAGNNLIKSKKRVADHGEVFTSEREVNAMLDLVKQETERIDSRFLEPACGDGNFLSEILRRKLKIVRSKYAKSQLEFERFAITAISSIYGVDILKDNVGACKDRLYSIFNEMYESLYKNKCKEECRKSVRFILDRNILWGDALSLRTVDEKKIPIVFSEWSFVQGSKIKRRDFLFAELAQFNKNTPGLFDIAEESTTGEMIFSPRSVKEYPLINFLELSYEKSN